MPETTIALSPVELALASLAESVREERRAQVKRLTNELEQDYANAIQPILLERRVPAGSSIAFKRDGDKALMIVTSPDIAPPLAPSDATPAA